MPSASLVSSKAQQPENAGKDAVNNGSIMAESPNEAPLWQAVQIVEKKVRNLEKRKVRASRTVRRRIRTPRRCRYVSGNVLTGLFGARLDRIKG